MAPFFIIDEKTGRGWKIYLLKYENCCCWGHRIGWPENVRVAGGKEFPSKGTYFQLLEYKAISMEGDTELAIRWTKEKKIASIPISGFYKQGVDNKLLRFCFAKSDETLMRGAEILNKIV